MTKRLLSTATKAIVMIGRSVLIDRHAGIDRRSFFVKGYLPHNSF